MQIKYFDIKLQNETHIFLMSIILLKFRLRKEGAEILRGAGHEKCCTNFWHQGR